MSGVTFTGLASGIDSSSIISSILKQRRAAQVVPLEKKITELTDTNSSLAKLQELLTNLKGTADGFREVNGSVLAKTAVSSSESRIVATASNSASNGTYNVNVLSLAKNGSSSFNDRFSSSSQVINASIDNGAATIDRTVSVQIGTGSEQENVSIELTNTSTASDFVSQFNATSQKAQASLVNVGTTSAPSYAVVINSNSSGTEKGEIAISVGAEITSAGGGAFTASTLSQATDATFTIDGVSGVFTRGSNSVSDVITGLTFNLQSTGTATLTVGDDGPTTSSSVRTFVDAFNEIVKYIDENDLVSTDESGQQAVFGTLSSTSLDENLLTALRSAFSAASTSGNSVNTLADLGITTERDGTLKFDASKFESSIASDPEAVRTITKNLGETLAGVSGTIAQFTRFNGLIDIAEQGNQNQIDASNARIVDLEKFLSQQEQQLTAQYSRLESVIGKLNSQQSALSGLL
jgi:flagellar hook-associated protein 2